MKIIQKIKLPYKLGKKYFPDYNITRDERMSIVLNGTVYKGCIEKEHPNFDISLVSGEHYYGKIDYYLVVF